MGTTAQKLQNVVDSKTDIGKAILEKGGGARPYDAGVEYILNTGGTQYIDTGIKYTLDTVVQISRGDFISHNGNYMVGEGTDTYNTRFFWNPGGVDIYARINGANARQLSAPDTLRNVEFGNLYIKNLDNGTIVAQGTTQTSLPEQNTLKIFSNSSGVGGRRDVWQCKWVKIIVNGNLVHDFIPVRIGSVGYLYDLANPTGGPNGNGLYGNSGTGSFVLGPDVSIPEKILPYKFIKYGDMIRQLPPPDLSDYDSTFLVFYDLDGNMLYWFSKVQVQSWTSESDMPPVPSSPNPTIYSGGQWNWTYADTRTALTNNTPGFVAPQYTRSDEATMVKVEFDKNTEIQLSLNDSDGKADWGDGSSVDNVSNGVLVSHSFSAGSYWIKITKATTNSISLGGNTWPMILPGGSTTTSGNRFDAMQFVKELYVGRKFQTVSNTMVGAKNIERIHYDSSWTIESNISSVPYRGTGQGYTNSFSANRYIPYRTMIIPRGYGNISRNGNDLVGVNIKLISWHPRARFYGNSGWSFCGFGNQVEHIRIPYIGTVTDSTSALFRYSLRALDILFGLDILSGVNGNYTFGDCQACRKIVFRNGFSSTRTVSNMFLNCKSLQELVGFNMRNIAIFNTSSFQNCFSMRWDDLYLPNVTSFGGSSFSGNALMFSLKAGTKGTDLVISNNSFTSCVNLLSAEFDGNVTSVGSASFQGNAKMKVVMFNENTQVPTLSNVNAFQNTSALAEIVVPDSLYDDWKAATNWSSTTNGIVNKITKASVYGGYTSRVEYLESTGEQWVDTGVSADNLTGFELTCTPFGAAGEKMGAASSGAGGPACGVVQTDEGFSISLKADDSVVSNDEILPGGTDSFVVSYDAEYGIGQVGDVSSDVDKSYLDEWATDNTFYLFAQNRGEASSFCHTRLYEAKIFYNDKLIHDYIPVRVDATGCLYDRMTNTLVYNQGTGDFIVGPDV